MKESKILIEYEGFFSHFIVNELIQNLYKINKANKFQTTVFKKVLVVMIEMLENNYNYIESIKFDLPEDIKSPYFKIVQTSKGIEIESSNPLKYEHLDDLKSRINEINKCNKQEIKELYLKTLVAGMNTPRKSAGVGLIRIAKVAQNKIKSSFDHFDNNFLYYTLQIFVNYKKDT